MIARARGSVPLIERRGGEVDVADAVLVHQEGKGTEVETSGEHGEVNCRVESSESLVNDIELLRKVFC
jgi:hypothetical protein